MGISKRAIVLFVIFGLWLPCFAPTTAGDVLPTCDTKTSSAEAGQGLNLIKSDEESIVLELSTSGYRVEEKTIGGVACHYLSIGGYGETSETGHPQLPSRGVMLGIPPEAKFELQVLETDSWVAAERYNVCPVPKAVIREDPYGLESLSEPYGVGFKSMEYVFARDVAVYSANAFYPTDLVEVTSSGYIRDQRFVRLQLHPLQYNPLTQQLRFYTKMKVELRFTYDESIVASSVSAGELGGSFEEVMRGSFINYESAKKWRHKDITGLAASIQGENPLASQLSYKIAVDEDGIYQLTYHDLLDAGVDVDNVEPHTFKLYNQGNEVAIHVHDGDDGSFDPGDYILFYGQKMDSRFTNTNIYWLTTGGSSGLRMSEKNGSLSGTAAVPPRFAATAHVEQDSAYRSDLPWVEDADHWFWNYLFAYGPPVTGIYTTTLSNIATSPYSATIRVSMHGSTDLPADPDHRVQVSFNGHLLDTFTWDGMEEYLFEMDVPHFYLSGSVNTTTVTLPLGLAGVSYDIVYVNWFEIDYYDTYVAENNCLRFSGDEAGTWEYHIDGFATNDIEVFDMTDPVNVSRIVSTTVESNSSHILKFEDTITDKTEYLALTEAQRLSPLSIEQDTTSDLHSKSNGADYIIITHSDFAVHLPDNDDDIYDLEGRRQSQGLRTMIVDVQDVYDEFSYGVFDPQAIRDFLAHAYAPDKWQAPAPSYVLLVGDGHYDFKNNLGNSPPNYIPPYLAFVDPTIGETACDNQYVTVSGSDPMPDMHIGRLPVRSVAEASIIINKIFDYEQNPPPGSWNQAALFAADNADDAGDFAAFSNDIADNYLPSTYTDQKVYYKVTHFTQSEATDAIVGAISQGQLLVNYIGHGGYDLWAKEGLFRADTIRNDINSLTNGPKLPMMLSMTCMVGYFHHPSRACLDESLLRADGKGAIASWSATGYGMALGHHYLNKGFFTAVFNDKQDIGTATYLGKRNLYENTSGYRDLLDTFVLFGDPFMKLNLPACDAADFDNDGQITVVDVMQVADHWDTQWGDEDFDRRYDLDNNGRTDIVDIMRVAAQWGEAC